MMGQDALPVREAGETDWTPCSIARTSPVLLKSYYFYLSLYISEISCVSHHASISSMHNILLSKILNRQYTSVLQPLFQHTSQHAWGLLCGLLLARIMCAAA
jgi:hypothetical protein